MFDIDNGLSLDEKLAILSDAAKYDVACTSSGVDRRGQKGMLGNSCAAGICHSFASDGRCISLLKILMTNHCSYDCKYCKNRKSNDIPRATFTPEEICTLTIEFYKRNYIEGLFLSSGVLGTPDNTMEKMCEALRMLRTTYRFNGYIHVKAIPGASQELIYSAGLLADRISINMELPTQDSLVSLAPNKSMTTILKPMNQISETIAQHRVAIGKNALMERAGINRHLVNSIFGTDAAQQKLENTGNAYDGNKINSRGDVNNTGRADNDISIPLQKTSTMLMNPAEAIDARLKRPFAGAGQSTQMIIGATRETDLELIRTTQSLYKSFDLKRVFFSGYVPLNEDDVLPSLGTPVPLLREHRLYQADWLLRFYGYQADELLTEENPFFNAQIDPKCDWAIRHLDQFPVEINTASYDMLLRVPGIGPTGVKRIMSARRYSYVNFDMLKKMRIVLKRAQYFITCNGKMLNKIPLEQQFITRCIANDEQKDNLLITQPKEEYHQMNLFTDFAPA
ncbi:MAG: putative DNA modification/repair radical SAM protein [Lachnospiraceae bacterium]|nr:putative DNA modification/repair radical SAM protein [Lachnospiraceae bacterium]